MAYFHYTENAKQLSDEVEHDDIKSMVLVTCLMYMYQTIYHM